jgi:hypothetical protein
MTMMNDNIKPKWTLKPRTAFDDLENDVCRLSLGHRSSRAKRFEAAVIK